MQFHRALDRPALPAWPRFPGASGPHKGLSAEQWASVRPHIPWEVVVLCAQAEDAAGTYVALQTSLDTHDVFDLLDISDLGESWKHAALFNQAHGN